MRSIEYGTPHPVSPTPVTLEQCLSSIGSSFGYSRRPPTAGIPPARRSNWTAEDEKLAANFGCEGTTKRNKVFRTLTEEEKAKLDPRRIDRYYFGCDSDALRPKIREPSPYKSREHMLLGDRAFRKEPEVKEPTLKDRWNTTEKYQEKYYFGC